MSLEVAGIQARKSQRRDLGARAFLPVVAAQQHGAVSYVSHMQHIPSDVEHHPRADTAWSFAYLEAVKRGGLHDRAPGVP